MSTYDQGLLYDRQADRPRTARQALVVPACLGLGLVAGLSSPIETAARIESRFFPVLEHQSIPTSSITRKGRWFCWSWIRDKVRAPEVLDLDVKLDTAGGDLTEPEIINADTGVPWHKGGSLPPGHYETPFCVALPAFVRDGDPVRVRQTLTYRGLGGWWTLSVPIPTITAP